MTRWVIITICVLGVIGLIGWAGGHRHHRGDEIGSHGTKVVVVHIVP